MSDALSTGVPGLNVLTRGLRRGRLYVVAGEDRPLAELLATQVGEHASPHARATCSYIDARSGVPAKARRAQQSNIALLLPTFLMMQPEAAPATERLPGEELARHAAQIWHIWEQNNGVVVVRVVPVEYGVRGSIGLCWKGRRLHDPGAVPTAPAG